MICLDRGLHDTKYRNGINLISFLLGPLLVVPPVRCLWFDPAPADLPTLPLLRWLRFRTSDPISRDAATRARHLRLLQPVTAQSARNSIQSSERFQELCRRRAQAGLTTIFATPAWEAIQTGLVVTLAPTAP